MKRAIASSPAATTYRELPSGLSAAYLAPSRPESVPDGAFDFTTEQAPEPAGPLSVSPVMQPS